MADDPCPDPDVVAALLEGNVSRQVRKRVEQHVDRCNDCWQLLLDMACACDDDAVASARSIAPGNSEVGIVAIPPGGAGSLSGLAGVLEAGEQVGPFHIERLLGVGGMGEVYLAKDREHARTVALKLISAGLVDSAEAEARFRVEAQATAKLDHPNIVAIHSVGECEGRPYVALEFVDGHSLRDELAERRPGLRRAVHIAREIAAGVAAAHQHGVWHRDLKPANVLVGDDDRVRVADFGLAKIIDAEGPPSTHALRNTVSRTGIVGTPLYMSPEQWRGEDTRAAADVWALGAILFELCSGRHPFWEGEGGSPSVQLAHVVARICDDSPPELAGIADVPAALSSLVARCLSGSAAERPTAAEVVEGLEEISAAVATWTSIRPSSPERPVVDEARAPSEPPASSSPEPPSVSESEPPRPPRAAMMVAEPPSQSPGRAAPGRGWLVLFVVVLLLGVVGAMLYGRSRPNADEPAPPPAASAEGR